MTLSEWIDYELSRQERWIHEIAHLPWEGYVGKEQQLTAHIAKAQVLRQVKKKLKESK